MVWWVFSCPPPDCTSRPWLPQFGRGLLWTQLTDQGRGSERKDKAKLTAIPLNDRDLLQQADNGHLAYPAKSTFHSSSPVLSAFFYNLKVSRSHFKVTDHPWPLLWQPGEKRNILRQERKSWDLALSHLGPQAADGRKREGEKKGRAASAGV